MKTFKIIALVAFISLIFAGVKTCQLGNKAFDIAEQATHERDSLIKELHLRYIEIQVSKDLAERYRNEASAKIKEVIQYRTITREIRIHDTLNQRFTDSTYCIALEKENDGLWQVHSLDSATIVHLETAVNQQDSVINTLNSAWNEEYKARWKAEAKANKEGFRKTTWKTVSVLLAAVTTVLIVNR